MARLPNLALPAIALALLSGCSDETAAPPAPIAFGAMGPLTGDAGANGFRFGAASAATQIEDGNVNTDWYVFTGPEADGGLGLGHGFVGDAAGGFTRAIDDVDLVRDMNLDSYRFSMSWSRIEPQRDVIDEDALAHYDALIDTLIAAGIRPMVTVHHFSNPVWIDDPRDLDCDNGPTDENLCGLGHPEGGALVVDEMREHAALLAERFGDRVDEWATLNEPVNYLIAGYGVGVFPPGKQTLFNLLDEFIPVVRDYLRAHGLMHAAIKAADTVDADGDGEASAVGLTLSVADWVPARFNEISDDPADVAGRDALVYAFHHLLPSAVEAGSFDSDLDGTPDEPMPEIAGTLDWLGVQYYFRSGVTANNGLIPVLGITPCTFTFDFGACIAPKDPTYCVPTMRYEYYAPGFYGVLRDYQARYPDLPLVVSEGGIATGEGRRRAENIVRTLEQIQRARDDGADIRGYYHWSLTDNFEWAEGYAPRFGLYNVDYDSFARTPTEGATTLGAIAAARTVTSEQRTRLGGDGPMTPDPDAPDDLSLCKGF